MDLALVLAHDSVDASRQARDAVQLLGDRLGVHISAVILTPADPARLPPDDPWWTEVSQDAQVLKGASPAQEAAQRTRPAQPA
jgi:hypothetical protein